MTESLRTFLQLQTEQMNIYILPNKMKITYQEDQKLFYQDTWFHNDAWKLSDVHLESLQLPKYSFTIMVCVS